MAQGFKPSKHTVVHAQALRWALFADVADAAIPTAPALLQQLIAALQGRIQRMDRTKDKRLSQLPSPLPTDSDALIRIVNEQLGVIARLDRTVKQQLVQRIRLSIRGLAQRDRWPDEMDHNWRRLALGHEELLYEEELADIREGKLTAVGCLPAVLRLQRDHLYQYMTRAWPDGYTPKDAPETWLQRNQHRLYEELAFYHCCCTYRPNLLIEEKSLKGPGELIPVILAALHAGGLPTSIQQLLKDSARPVKVPAFLK